MKFLALIIVLLVHFLSYSQQELALEVGIGMSRIYNNNVSNLTRGQVKFERSESVQLIYTSLYDEHVGIRTGIKYVDLRGLNALDIFVAAPTGLVFRTENSIRLQYLAFPLLFGYKKSKFQAFTGIQGAFLIRDRGVESGSLISMNQLIPFTADFDNLNLKNWDFGALVSLEYSAHKRFSFTLNYYHGTSNISDSQEINDIWKTQQATFGIKYKLGDDSDTGL